jgi:hypothetical protein|tara:strand:+ start:5470 stop:5748 length:279 start_codon:yes stop_codon:yes gene_type:complete
MKSSKETTAVLTVTFHCARCKNAAKENVPMVCSDYDTGVEVNFPKDKRRRGIRDDGGLMVENSLIKISRGTYLCSDCSTMRSKLHDEFWGSK